jgi:hypothetical protein
MDRLGDGSLEDKGHIVVVRFYVPVRESANIHEIERHDTHFAYSIRDSVTDGAYSLPTSRKFLGGEGHCSERRSLVWLPIVLDVNIVSK